MKDIDQIRRENLIAESTRLGGDTNLGGVLDRDKNQIYQWLRAPDGTQRRNMSKGMARKMEIRLDRPRFWLDIDHETSQKPGDSPAPLITRERRASDDVTALQIAIESLAVALLRRTRGSASGFVSDMDSMCDRRRFSKDHALLGRLSGIAQQVQSDEAAEDRVQRRANLARRTKP